MIAYILLPIIYGLWRRQAEGWTDLVKFLQELCGLARHLQPNARAELLGQLVNLGLFEVGPALFTPAAKFLITMGLTNL